MFVRECVRLIVDCVSVFVFACVYVIVFCVSVFVRESECLCEHMFV